MVFIPTRQMWKKVIKSWLIDDLADIEKLGLKSIEVVDISVEEKYGNKNLKKPIFFYFEGGYTYYLMEWINKSGLAKILPELLKTKVYVGASAGSMVTGKRISS